MLFRLLLHAIVRYVCHTTMMCWHIRLRSLITVAFMMTLLWRQQLSGCSNTSSGTQNISAFGAFAKCRPTEMSWRCRTVMAIIMTRLTLDMPDLRRTGVVAALLGIVAFAKRWICRLYDVIKKAITNAGFSSYWRGCIKSVTVSVVNHICITSSCLSSLTASRSWTL